MLVALEDSSNPLFRVRDIIEVVGVRDPGGVDRDAGILGVNVDSRRVVPGDLFVALKGERTDGHQYIPDALERGAAACLMMEGRQAPGSTDSRCLEVPDPLEALGSLAEWYRRGFMLSVVGVTGSVGKTTCKDMIAGVLGADMQVLKTMGNYNTEIGVPLTLFDLRPFHQAAVLELAMRNLGDIDYLVRMARPEIGVLTNVREAHLETLGSIQNIALAKGELFTALPEDGWAIINGDDEWGRWIASQTPAQTLFYGVQSDDAEVWADHIVVDDLARPEFDMCFRGGGVRRVRLSIAGRHHVMNALAAACVGSMMGVSPGDIADGISRSELTGMRMQWMDQDQILILNDAYNSSPTSCAAALQALSECRGGGRKVAVLGDMLEMGSRTHAGHQEVGCMVPDSGVDLLVTVGEMAAIIGEAAVDKGLPPSCHCHYADLDELTAGLPGIIRRGDVVLVKASRGCRLERCVQALQELFPGRNGRE